MTFLLNLPVQLCTRAQVWIPPGWESIPGLFRRFTNIDSAKHFMKIINVNKITSLAGEGRREGKTIN